MGNKNGMLLSSEYASLVNSLEKWNLRDRNVFFAKSESGLSDLDPIDLLTTLSLRQAERRVSLPSLDGHSARMSTRSRLPASPMPREGWVGEGRKYYVTAYRRDEQDPGKGETEETDTQ